MGVPLHVPIVVISFGVLLSSSTASFFLRFLTPFHYLYNGATKFFFTRNRRQKSSEKRVGALIENPLGMFALKKPRVRNKIAFVKCLLGSPLKVVSVMCSFLLSWEGL